MPAFSQTSMHRLDSCHKELQALFLEVVRTFDCSIVDGHRGEKRQQELFNAVPQRSKVQWPNSRHNSKPSGAVDVAPYPIDWNDTDRFYFFGGYVLGLARMLGIKVRWGGDWDRDTQVQDHTFKDLPHYELI